MKKQTIEEIERTIIPEGEYEGWEIGDTPRAELHDMLQEGRMSVEILDKIEEYLEDPDVRFDLNQEMKEREP